MTATWTTIGVLAVVTAAIRASGPVLLGGRDLPPRLVAVITLLAPALLAALVVTQTVGDPAGVPVIAATGAALVGLLEPRERVR